MNQTPDPIQPDLVRTAPDGSPLREDGTPYPEGLARGGADFADNTQPAPAPAPIETGSEIVLEKPMGALADSTPLVPSADAFSLTVDTDEKSKILHVAIGDGTTDRIPFVCLPQISAFAELAVVEAQVEISEMVETMRNSDANQGNGRPGHSGHERSARVVRQRGNGGRRGDYRRWSGRGKRRGRFIAFARTWTRLDYEFAQLGILDPWELPAAKFYRLGYGAATKNMTAEQLEKFHDALDGKADEKQEARDQAARRAGQDNEQVKMRREMARAKTPGERLKAREAGRQRRLAALKAAKERKERDGV